MNLLSKTASLPSAIERCRHPAQHRMPDPLLNVSDHLSGIRLIPAPVQLFGRATKLNDEIAGEVLRLNFAPLLPPQPE